MNKITIIELLNKIANGETVPKRIEYDNEEFVFNEEWHTYVCCDHDLTPLFSQFNFLNDEVEILEDKTEEIEELNYYTIISAVDGKFQENIDEEFGKHTKKINELVRAINKLNKQNTKK